MRISGDNSTTLPHPIKTRDDIEYGYRVQNSDAFLLPKAVHFNIAAELVHCKLNHQRKEVANKAEPAPVSSANPYDVAYAYHSKYAAEERN